MKRSVLVILLALVPSLYAQDLKAPRSGNSHLTLKSKNFTIDDNTVTASSQTPDVKAPALTTEQKQTITIKLQEMQIAQLQFDKARTELGALVQTLQKDGYTLNLQTLEYAKKTDH